MSEQFEPIIEEDFFVWVAPDGNMQLSLLAPDIPMCLAVARLFHTKGLAQSPHEMKLKGFRMEKVKVTIVHSGESMEEAFNPSIKN